MKFLVGLATGIVLGAAGAVAYSMRTGTDLRESFEGVRSDIEKRDFDRLSARFESGLSELQAVMDERLNQIKASTVTAIEEANKAIDEGRAKVASATGDTGNGIADLADSATTAASDAADSATATAESVFSDAADGATAFAGDAADAAQDLAHDAADTVEETLDVAADTLEESREG